MSEQELKTDYVRARFVLAGLLDQSWEQAKVCAAIASQLGETQGSKLLVEWHLARQLFERALDTLDRKTASVSPVGSSDRQAADRRLPPRAEIAAG